MSGNVITISDLLRETLRHMVSASRVTRNIVIDVFTCKLRPDNDVWVLAVAAQARDGRAYELSFCLTDDLRMNQVFIDAMVEQADKWKKEVW